MGSGMWLISVHPGLASAEQAQEDTRHQDVNHCYNGGCCCKAQTCSLHSAPPPVLGSTNCCLEDTKRLPYVSPSREAEAQREEMTCLPQADARARPGAPRFPSPSPVLRL